MNVMKTELDALPTEAKYEFITWDWKQQIDANELNEALQRIPYARVADVNTGVDALAMVVHSPEIHKTAEEWEELYPRRTRRRKPMRMLDIEPVSPLGCVGAQLFKARIREMAARCDTRRMFNRAMENEILPSIRALFDHRVAHDVLRAAREVYGRRGEHAKRPQEEGPAVAPTTHGETSRAGILGAGPRAKGVSPDATGRRL